MPRLPRRRKIEISEGRETEARLARGLLLAGVASVRHWEQSRSNVREFLLRVLRSWIAEGYGTLPQHDGLNATFVHSFADAMGHSDDGLSRPDVNTFYVAITADAGQRFYLGNAMRILAEHDSRMASSFYYVISETINSHYFCLDWRDLDWLIEGAVEAIAEEEGPTIDEDAFARMTRDFVPVLLRPKAYSRDQLAVRALRGLPPAAQRLVKQLNTFAALHRGGKHYEWPQELQELDLAQPLPGFLLGFDQRDSLDGIIDEYDHMITYGGEEPGPAAVIEFDISNARSVLAARERVIAAARVTGHALELLESLPVSDDAAALVNVLV